MKDVNEFFEMDKENNFFLKKDIKLDDDSKQQLLANILEIQQNIATEYVENQSKYEDSNLSKKIS
jgi:hypothetical protein